MRPVALALLALALLAPPGAQAKVGLAMRFGDVILEDAKPGRTYNLREVTKMPFGVENRSDAEVEVLIQFERPRTAVLSANYEQAPDLSWFKATPERIKLGPKSVGFFNLLLTVPDDPKLVGRHFQVSVTARSVPGSGGMLGVAIENRLRFSIGPGPETLKEEKKRKAMQQLDFDVTPQALYLTGVPVGQAYDAKRDGKKSIRIANYAQDTLVVRLSLEAWDASIPMPEGYDRIPNLEWVKLKTSTVSVGAEEIGQASLVVEVPDEAEYKGKRWAAMIRTGLATGFWLDAPVKVFIETNP